MNSTLFFKCKLLYALIFLFGVTTTFAQCSPDFGTASNFALFSISGAVSNVASSNVNGDVGANTGAIAGFGSPSIFTGTIHSADALTTTASTDLVTAYNLLMASVATNSSHAPAFGSGETLVSGVYTIGGAGSVAGNLTLDAQGNPDAVFIFKIGGAFTTGAGTNVMLTNGTAISNVFWIADGAIAMAANTTMCGTLISNNGAVSMGDQGFLYGRLYTTTGAISIYGTTVNILGVDSKAIGGSINSNQSIDSVSSLTDLTLTASSGTVVKWQKSNEITFGAPIDIANTSTTLTKTIIGNLTVTTYFRAVVQKLGCVITTAYSSPCTISILATTWNGTTWSNGLPSLLKAVFITNDFTSSGSFMASKMDVIGANVIILSGDTITLNGPLSVESGSTFTMQMNANLIQTSNSQNVGVITIQKDSAPLKRLDYVLWSSPVEGQLMLPFSPATLTNRFYFYNGAINFYNVIPSPAVTSFSSGRSNLIRMPYNHPTTPTVWHGTFNGVPNNGDVNLAVTNGTYNGIGNPYPSGINANTFMADNNITEAMYFWRKSNNPNNTSYAVYTTAGGTCNTQGDPLHLAPGSIIPIGQGFIAKATSSAINFTNAMRTAAINVPLLKSAALKSRLWLDLSSVDGFFSQALIAYMPNATNGIDDAIDGRFFNDSQTALTSIINGEKFSIQGRPLPFSTDDVVPLGFQSELDNTFTIALNHFDGLFSDGQNIYIRDNSNGVVTDLKLGNYTFATLAGVFNNRFELLYQNSILSNNAIPAFNANYVVIYHQKSDLVINTGIAIMSSIKIFNVKGVLLFDKKEINTSETRIDIGSTNEVLLVEIVTTEGMKVVKKVYSQLIIGSDDDE